MCACSDGACAYIHTCDVVTLTKCLIVRKEHQVTFDRELWHFGMQLHLTYIIAQIDIRIGICSYSILFCERLGVLCSRVGEQTITSETWQALEFLPFSCAHDSESGSTDALMCELDDMLANLSTQLDIIIPEKRPQ